AILEMDPKPYEHTAPTFESVYVFSMKAHPKGRYQKAEATNLELRNDRVHQQVGTMIRHILKTHFTERFGFFRIPNFFSERLKIDVTDLLRFYTDKTADYQHKLKHGLLQDDIARKLIAKIKGGTKSNMAAAEVWEEIKKAYEQAEGKDSVKITEDINGMSNIDVIRENLVDAAGEAAVLYYGSEVVRELHKGGAEARECYKKIRKEKRLRLKERDQIEKIIKHEFTRMQKDNYFQKKILAALDAGNVELALQFEQKMRYKGDSKTYAAQYRHGEKLPELAFGRGRSISEIAAWLNTTQKAMDWTVENGELLEDGKLIRRIADISDRLIAELKEGSRELITADIAAEKNEEIELLEEYLRNETAEHRLFNNFDKEKGEQLGQRIDAFEGLLEAVLRVEEGKANEALLNKLATRNEKDIKEDPSNLQPELKEDRPIVNVLNRKRFPMTAIESVRADLQMNADTDNIFYPELMDAASHFGYLWGVLSRPNEVIQYGLNYEVLYRSPFCRFQRDRDLGGPQNQSVIRAALAPLGKNRLRSKLIEFTGTLTGYANLLPMSAAYQATEYVIEANPQSTSYHGYKAFEKIFGSAWEERDDWFGKIINRNPVNKLFGWQDGWDAAMATDRWLKIIPSIAAAGLIFGNLVNYLFDYMFGGSFGNPTFYPKLSEVGGLKFGMKELIIYPLGILAGLKILARIFGSSLDLYNYYRGRRVYVIDPSEDLATTMPLRVMGFKLTLAKGLRQMNDAMIEYDGDMFQKLRWQAQNAANFSRVMRYIWDYRKVLTKKESFDLLQGPLYNMFGLPGTFNRWAILAFVFLGEPSVLVNDNYTFLQNNLEWIVELGFLNYLSIEGMLRLSRMRAGSSWKGAGANFGYETTMLGFNYINVSRRAISGAKFGFNATDPPAEPCLTEPTGWFKKNWLKTRLEGPSGFMFRNKFKMALEGYALYHIATGHLAEAIAKADFWQIYMATLLFWIGSRFYYNWKGHKLNTGISRISSEKEWEDKHKVWRVK
ncbi:hypothetical protein ACFL52_02940, partial [Candidatus Margulisiibacteriota bacterium]